MFSVRNPFFLIIGLSTAWWFSATLVQAQSATPESVVVVANRSVSGSVKVAKTYMNERGIPKSNLITIRSATDIRINRRQYIQTIHNPIIETLLERELINALNGDTDAFGRKTATVIDNPIRYMVLCYGVPAIIQNKPLAEVDDLHLLKRQFRGPQEGLVRQFSEGPTAKNAASVDGELALLLKRDIPLNGFFPNPYFRNREYDHVRDVIKVTRLDGPSPRAVIGMLENALLGERKGLKGRAYVDEDGRSGAYQTGNNWLGRTADTFAAMGFEVQRDTAREPFGAGARFDAPVLYAGWYAFSVQGPFTLPGFRFPPGAVAAHLHSTSAAALRSPNQGWVGPFVERGVSATFGNVDEPFLRFTHHFDLFFKALAEGWNLADAAYFALPVLSWQAVTIGDPLYRPFKVTLEEQLAFVGLVSEDPLDAYVYLRRARLLNQEGKVDDAIRVMEEGMRITPGPALALELAGLLGENGRPEPAEEILRGFIGADLSEPTDWRLFTDLADKMRELGNPAGALAIYQKLEQQKIPGKVQLAFLNRGIQAAEEAGKPDLANAWRMQMEPLPPPSKSSGTVPSAEAASEGP